MPRTSRHAWFLSRFGSRRQAVFAPRSTARLLPFRRRLRIEPLENRRLLSITVDTLVDEDNGVGNGEGTSLREAIAASPSGGTIDFSVNGTINLVDLGDLVIDKDLTIDGPGANLLTISAYDPTPENDNGDGSRVFLVDDDDFGPDEVVTISGLTLSDGDVDGSGGAIDNGETLSLSDVIISGNAAAVDGGGINNRAELTIARSALVGNKASFSGGGIMNVYGTVTVIESTLSGNTALVGGGIMVFGPELTLSNSTVSGNSATTDGGGVTVGYGIVRLSHSTITGNVADSDNNASGTGGGIWAGKGSPYYVVDVELDHTIVAGNTRGSGVGSDLAGPVDARYSLVGDDTDATITDNGGNLIGTGASPIDPRLALLADNGGPTLTHRLLPISPAIDAGDPDFVPPPDFDQRGGPFMRVFDGNGDTIDQIDIGAFESNVVVFIVDTADDETDGDYSEGDFSLREAIELANASATVETISFDPALDGETITLHVLLGELSISASVIIETAGLSGGLTVDASGTDFTPGLIDGFGTRAVVVDDEDDGTLLDVTIDGLTIQGADHANSGGAVFNDEKLTLINSVLTGNAAQWGGGIYNAENGDLTVIGSTITGNTATGTGSGGGVYNFGGTAAIVQSTISFNDAPDGGGIRNVNGGFLSLSQSSVNDNFANGIGGGILNDGNTATIEDSTISGNDATFGAGLYHATGDMDIVRSTISGNVAASSGGGLLNNFANLTVTDSTLSGNSGTYGGGIYIAGEVVFDTTITNTTISANTASLGGGGMYNFQGNVVISHSTITENEAPADQGSGVFTWADPFTALTTVYSSIIAGNVGSDVDGATELGVTSFVSAGFNLIGSGTAVHSFESVGDQTELSDPRLGPLQDNGGPTFTHALESDSSAIDAGDPDFDVPPEFDQRGAPFARVVGGRIDIGAFEDSTVPPELPGDYNLDEIVDSLDYVLWRITLDDDVDDYEGADGSGDGHIGDEDHGVWAENFGEMPPPEAASSASGVFECASSEPLSMTLVAEVAMPVSETLAHVAASAAADADGPSGVNRSRAFRMARTAHVGLASRDDALVAWLGAYTHRGAVSGSDESAPVHSVKSELDRESALDVVDSVFESLSTKP